MFEFITTPPKGVFLFLFLLAMLIGIMIYRMRKARLKIYKNIKNVLRSGIKEARFVQFSEFYELSNECAPKVNGRCKGRVIYLRCSTSETFASVIGCLKSHLCEEFGYQLSSDTGAILGAKHEMRFARGTDNYLIVVTRRVPQPVKAKMYMIRIESKN